MQTVYACGGGGGRQQREVADGADVVFRDTASLGATDEYSRHSVHVTQPYTGTTAYNQLTPRQN